jgi:hypothetical protein
MQGAIKRTCSHCQRETYFAASVGIRLEAISTSACTRCGRSGAVIVLNVAAPEGAVIQECLLRMERCA